MSTTMTQLPERIGTYGQMGPFPPMTTAMSASMGSPMVKAASTMTPSRSRRSTERIRAAFPKEGDHSLEEASLLGRQVRHVDLCAARSTRSEEGELSFPIREDLVAPLAHLPQLVLQQKGLGRVGIFLCFFVRGLVEPRDVRGEFVVEIRFQGHQSLLSALLAVHLRDAFKIHLLLARHNSHIRRPIYDGFLRATLIVRGPFGE